MQSLLKKTLYVLPDGLDYGHLADLAERLTQEVPLTGYLVTSCGLVEIQVPSDTARILDFKKNGDFEWRILRNFDMTPYLCSGDSEKNEDALVHALVAKANEILPEGFKIELHSYDNLSLRNNKSLLQKKMLQNPDISPGKSS